MADITGDNAGNILIGTDNDDNILGQGGDDLISAMAGVDVVDGGDGDDTINGGAGNDKLNGSQGDDTLSGDLGNDLLDGGLGADKMTGGIGDDTYLVDDAGDTVTEDAVNDFDTVASSISYALGANIERLILSGMANINGTGNVLDNSLTGNDGNNKLSGAAGNDFIIGVSGDDTLDGGAGNDTLIAGEGSDTFDFNFLDGSLDTITDFVSSGTGDVLDVSDLLVGFDPGTSDLDDFVQFVQQGGDTLVQVNADGIGADFVSIALLQGVTLDLATAVANGSIVPTDPTP